MKAKVKNKQIIISEKVKVASSLTSRVLGLMFKKNLSENESLLIEPCNSIHTCFMNFAIDVVFISKDNVVIHVIENMRPWKFSSIYFKSKKVLELKGGTLKNKILKGDQLEFENV